MEDQEKTYKSMETRFYQADMPYTMTAELNGYSNDTVAWDFSLWNGQTKEIMKLGNLRETIELILLGKLMLAETQEKAREPEYHGLDQLEKCEVAEIEAATILEKVNHSS